MTAQESANAMYNFILQNRRQKFKELTGYDTKSTSASGIDLAIKHHNFQEWNMGFMP